MARPINDEWETFTPEEDEWENIPKPFIGAGAGMTFPYTPGEAERKSGERGRVAEVGAALGRGFLGLGKAAIGLTEKTTPIFKRTGVGLLFRGVEKITGKTFEEEQAAMKEKVKAAEVKLPQTREGIEGWALNVLGEGAPYLAATISTGGYTMAGPVVIGFAMGGESAYEKAKAGGASEKQALLEYGLGGIAEAALETWGVSKLLKFKAAGKGSLKALIGNLKKGLGKQAAGNLKNISSDVLKSALVEGLEEASQQGASIAIPGILRKDLPRTVDGKIDWGTILTEIGEAGAGGALLGAVVPSGMNIPAGLGEAARPTRVRIEKAAQTIQDSKVLGDVEKARMINELKELPTVQEQIPSGSNVYKTAEGRVVIETPTDIGKGIGTVEKDGRVYDRQTNEELFTAPELSVSGIAGGKSPFDITGSAQRVLDIADKLNIELGEAVAEVAKPEARQARKKRKEKVWAEYARLLKTEDFDPVTREKMARKAMEGYIRDRIPQTAEKFSREDVADLYNAVHEATILGPADKMNVTDFLESVFTEKVMPHPSRIKAFDSFFGTNIWEQTKKHRTKGKKIGRFLSDVMNVPKAIWASGDVSFPLRQGYIFVAAHPIKAAPIFGRMYRAFASNEYHKLREIERKTDPLYSKFIQKGLAITEAGSRTKGEEYFESEIAHQLPIYGKMIKSSDQAFTTFSNESRVAYAKHFYENMRGSDVDTDARLQEAIDFVNHSTGRGGFRPGTPASKWYDKYKHAFSAVFWTPKLTMGRVQTISDLATKPHIRKLIANDLVRALGSSFLALRLLKLLFGKKMTVEKNPLSSDVGKGKVENTRFDFFGGYLQLFRYVSQFAAGKKKSALTGDLNDADRTEILKRFLRSKVNPIVGMAWDIAAGETFLGKKVTTEPEFMAEYTLEHIVPLFWQDVVDAVRFQGMDTASFVLPLAAHGVGANTYEVTALQEELEAKDAYAHEVYGKDWNELGSETQDLLRMDRPSIIQAEERTAAEEKNYTRVGKRIQAQQDVGKKIQKGLSKPIRNEFDRLGIRVGGLGQRLNTNWYLSQARYKEYQNTFKKLLEKEIAPVIFSPSWKQFDRQSQKDMLDQLVKDLKRYARQQVVDKANFKDLEEYYGRP